MNTKEEFENNNNNDNIFDIFHEDYEGNELKNIIERDNVDLTIEFRNGKNILFALACNYNVKEYFQLVKNHFKKLGKDIKKYLNQKDDNGNTLLNYVIVNYPHILNNLDENNDFSNGDKSLIESKCLDNIKYLVEEGCDLNVETNNKNYLEYLNSKTIIDDEIISLLNYQDYVLNLCKYLIDNGVNPYYDDNRIHLLIYGACENGHIELLKLLLKNNADINTTYDSNTLLDIAKENKHSDIVKYLNLKKNINDNQNQNNNDNNNNNNNMNLIKNGNKIQLNSNIVKNINDLNKEERLEILRNEFIKTNRLKDIKLKLVRKQ